MQETITWEIFYRFEKFFLRCTCTVMPNYKTLLIHCEPVQEPSCLEIQVKSLMESCESNFTHFPWINLFEILHTYVFPMTMHDCSFSLLEFHQGGAAVAKTITMEAVDRFEKFFYLCTCTDMRNVLNIVSSLEIR